MLIINALNSDQTKYQTRGFNITDIHGEHEFNIKALEFFLQSTILHVYRKDEHLGILYTAIFTVKERTRLMCHAVLYKQ